MRAGAASTKLTQTSPAAPFQPLAIRAGVCQEWKHLGGWFLWLSLLRSARRPRPLQPHIPRVGRTRLSARSQTAVKQPSAKRKLRIPARKRAVRRLQKTDRETNSCSPCCLRARCRLSICLQGYDGHKQYVEVDMQTDAQRDVAEETVLSRRRLKASCLICKSLRSN